VKSFPFIPFFSLALLAAVASPTAFATVRFEVIADRLNASASPAPVATLILVVADTQNNGLGFPLPGSIAVGNFLDGADDLILFRGDLNQSMLNTPGALSADTGPLSFSGAWGPGDNIYLVWFPALTIAANSLAGGESYGAIPIGTTPPDGGTSTPFYVTVDATGVFGPGSAAATSADMTTGAPPEIVVRGSGIDITDGPSTPVTGNLTDFGSTAMTGGTVVRTFTIHNTGTLDLTLGAPTVDGAHASDFDITSSPASPVTEGNSTSFQITFNPSATGLRTATVNFSNNDPDENPFNFSIQGTGADSEPTDITLTGSSIAENGGANATVGTLSGFDPDGDTLTFSLVDGAGDNVSFSISGTSLRLTAPADFETKSSYAVVIRATSGLDLFYDEPFTVNITNVNETPVFIKGANQTISAGITSAQTINGWATGISDGDSTVTQSLSFNVSVVSGSGLFTSQPAINSAGTLSYTPEGTDGSATVSITLTDDTSINGQPAITTAAQTFTIMVAATGPEIAVSGNNNMDITDGDSTPATEDHTDFGSAMVSDGTVTRTFTIRNLGDSSLTVGAVEKAGPHAADFSVVNGAAGSLATSGTKTFQVTFDPSATGLRVATLSFSTNDANENPFQFSIQGTGTAPEIAVTSEDGTSIANGDSTPDPSDHTDFGFTNPSGGTVTRTFLISNPGTSALDIGNVEIDGTNEADFTVSQEPAASVPPDQFTTFKITFDPSALGVRTATVSFVTNDDDENPFTFSILGADDITDGNINGFTDAEEAAIKALRTQYRVGDSVDPVIDLSFLLVTPTQRLVVTGLPPGVTFNGSIISGRIDGELGDAPGEIQRYNGKIKSSLPFHFTVSPYLFTGSFEALILDETLPVGKAKLVITTPGSYSATLELQEQTIRTRKGSFPTSGGATQAVEVEFPALRAFPPATIRFEVPSTSDLVSGSLGDNSLKGFRLAKAGRSTSKLLTVTLANDVPGDRVTTPGGSGYATGTLSSTGLLSLKGFLGDGQAATLSLNLSQTNQAVVFAQPYADRSESFFGGILTIGDLGAPGRGGSKESQSPGLQWRKKANATATSYRNGFGPLAITGRVSRWVPMTSAEGLALSLGLNLREIAVSYTAAPISTLPLPSRLALRNRFTLVRLLPTNAVAWSGKAVPSNGTFSGTLSLAAPATGTTVAGVLLQDPAFLEQIGAGFVKIPITAPPNQTALPRGSFETAGIRLQNN